VVDDNADAAETVANLVRLEGHDVRVAYDGAAALAAAEAFRPAVAFIDLDMPDMDGVELAARLRATARGRAITLVALTGMGQASDVARTRRAGFAEHLTKPAEPARILGIVAAADGGDGLGVADRAAGQAPADRARPRPGV
jgi:CheY-like chemotaxis protein